MLFKKKMSEQRQVGLNQSDVLLRNDSIVEKKNGQYFSGKRRVKVKICVASYCCAYKQTNFGRGVEEFDSKKKNQR